VCEHEAAGRRPAQSEAAASGRLVMARTVIPRAAPGAAVLEALGGFVLRCEFQQCAVGGLPGSGTPARLMDAAGFFVPDIFAAAGTMLAS
jgi:transketolase